MNLNAPKTAKNKTRADPELNEREATLPLVGLRTDSVKAPNMCSSPYKDGEEEPPALSYQPFENRDVNSSDLRRMVPRS
uniref:Uncharacterized protein n=1 Tax=Sphaerodactylus townsendi TaxID=933632 RepID=A0ACB8F308_9SAUR